MRALSLLALLALAACQPGTSRSADGLDTETFTILDRRSDERACTLTVRDADGTVGERLAGFDICDLARLWTDSTVTATVAAREILAESCDENPDCTDTDRVDLVIDIAPAR